MLGDSDPIGRRSVLRGVATASALSGVATTVTTADERGTERPTGREIERALLLTADHMTLYGDNTLNVDGTRARSDGVSPRQVHTAKKFETMHNLLIEALGSAETSSQSERYRRLQSWFEPYFQLVASGKARKAIRPETTESGSALDRDGLGTLDGGCGGTRENPHNCPDRYVTTDGPWETQSEVQDVLVNNGFHETAGYASGYVEDGRDYTKGVDASGCSSPKFRTHAIVFNDGEEWLYNTQTPEPNPEVLGYVWPTATWGTYVEWWHTEFC